MSNPDESQGDAAWRLLNALPAAHASTASVSTGSGSGGTQSQVVLPSAEVPAVDAYRGFGLAGDSMDVDQEQGEGQEAQGGGVASHVQVFKKPFLPQPSPSQPPAGPVLQAIASSSRAANKQPPSPVPMSRNLRRKPLRRAPSPDPPSQDSFGMPTGSQERARFMRDNGGRLAQLVAEADAGVGAGPRRASPESSQTQSSSEPGDRSREMPEPVVLVAGTPSQSQSQSQDPLQEQSQAQSQSQNPAQDDDEDCLGGGQSSQMFADFVPPPHADLDMDEDENTKSDDSFDARVQEEEEDEENATQLVATQVVDATQETQPIATGTNTSAMTGLSEQQERMLRMHNPKKFQAMQRSLRAANASNSTSNPTPSDPSGPTPSAAHQTHPTNTNNSVADRAFVHDGDETQPEPEGTPPPGPLIETQLQSPPRTVPRKRQIPSAKSTQRPATANTSMPPPTPEAPSFQTAREEQQHSSPATNHTHSGPSQSSVVPPSVASEVSAPPMSRPPPSQFLSASMIAPRRPREQDEEIVPDSNLPSSMSMGDAPSSQPVPLAVMLTRKRESEALAKVAQDNGKGKAKEVPPVGKENEKMSLSSDASLGPKRQPLAKHKYGGRRSGDDAPPPTDEAQTLLALAKLPARVASPEAFPGEEDMSLTSPSEGEHEPDPESQPPLKAGSPRRGRLARRSPTVEATDPAPRPPRRVVRGARRAVEPMISMEAVPEAVMGIDLDDDAPPPPSQPSQKRSRAATRVRRTSAAAAMHNLKEETDSEEEGGGAEDDGSWRETQTSTSMSAPAPVPVKPATRGTRKSAGAAVTKAAPSTAAAQPQAQRGQKRRRVSDNAAPPAQQTQRKRPKLEEGEAKMPTVFALYKTDKKYYPATITGMEGHSYSVSYADGCLGSVPADQLRPGPAAGEQLQVRIRGKPKTFTILSLAPSGLRVAEGADGEDEYEEELQWSQVFRTKAIAGTVPLTPAQIDALLREGASEEPTRPPASAAATPAAPAQSAREYSPSARLKDLAFVLTCSAAGDRAWRDGLPYDIQDAQGKVLQDWSDIVSFGPPPGAQGRWHAKAADIVPRADADKRAFLLTDVAVMTPKYLVALALGIPCVSMHWAFDVLEGKADVEEWHSYLLCAGEAEHLGAPVSQVIATRNGNSPTVQDAVAKDGWVRASRQRRMPFLGKTVLLVGDALVPTDKDQFTAQRCIAPVCLAMGASEVEAVHNFALAGARRFDIVIVEDRARPSSSDVRARMAVNGMQGTPTWVKQCLITGKLLDPPSRA